MRDRLGHGLSVVVWLIAVVVIALGASGLVAATEAETGRAEQARLTYTGDATLTPALDAAEADLAALAGDVDALGIQARRALAASVASDTDAVDAAVAVGDKLLVKITTDSGAIAAELGGMPFVSKPDAPLYVSPALLDRHARLASALKTTDGLQAAWDRLTVSATAAGRLSEQLAKHDALVAKAASQGREAKYSKAIATLKDATKIIAATKTFRDRLANTVDVTVLDQWLARNDAYDGALSNLYGALDTVGGKVTSKVRKAITAEKAARAQLPPDARGLVIIMSDIAQGGLNGAVVAIEEAKAALSHSLEPVAPEASPAP